MPRHLKIAIALVTALAVTGLLNIPTTAMGKSSSTAIRLDVGACTGTVVPAGANLHPIIDGASNRTFCLEAGTFDVGVSPLKPGNGVTIQGVEGTRSDQGAVTAPTKIVGAATSAIIEARNGDTFRWLDVSGSRPDSACQPDCGRGIKSGPNMLVEYSRIHDNSNNGIGGGVASTVTVRFSELDHNGTDGFKGTYGGIKAAASAVGGVLIVTDSYAHDNIGMGIWGDRCQDRMVAQRNLVVANSRDGIKWETNMSPSGCPNSLTRSALIESNTVTGNGTDPSLGDAGIKIRNSPNAEVRFNTSGRNDEEGVLIRYNGTAGSIQGTRINDNVSPDGIEGCGFTGVTCLRNG